jgi:replicative DNA helicase
MLSDLRESGAIEEAADCVIGMYRDDYYYEDSKTPGIVELILLKHRHGPTGTIEVGFRAQSTSFYNIEPTY